MTHEIERWIADWFHAWTGGWIEAGDRIVRRNLVMKQEHTGRVVSILGDLARAKKLDCTMARLCRISGWLHDVGRFPQFFRYRTFADDVSCSHDELSVQESESGPLSWLSGKDAGIVRIAVRYHSAFSIPDDVQGDARLVSALVRDADKLDIWRIVLHHYENGAPSDSLAIGPGLLDEGWNPGYVEALLDSRCAVTADKRSLTDLRLLQIGWIFDLWSDFACRVVEQEGYLERLLVFLPENEVMDRVRAHVRDFLAGRVRVSSHYHGGSSNERCSDDHYHSQGS